MISPLDDRYYESVKELDDIFSEKNYIEERVFYEKEWLVFLLEKGIFEITNSENKESISEKIRKTIVDYKIVKKIETTGYENIKPTNHDVKAIELALKINLKENIRKYYSNISPYVHFGITSEDVDNLAIADMLRKGNNVLLKNLECIINNLNSFAEKYANMVMLSRTHGQVASPTTLGKEFRNYCERLREEKEKLKAQEYIVKFSGSTGNFNAFYYALPEIKWLELAKEFVNKFDFQLNIYSTQKEPNDWQAELFQKIIRINNILLDFSQNIWNYISLGYLRLEKRDIGSSVMPHKINPIEFENAEGNLEIANHLFDCFSKNITVSRYQRDLSDSTMKRNYGVAYGHSLLSYKKILSGLENIVVNEKKIDEELNEHAEVLAEAVQIKLRTLGCEDAYETLRSKFQGKELSIEEFKKMIEDLNIPNKVKEEFLKLEVKDYFGIADEIARKNYQ